jgi:hypothetical protein
MRKPHLFLSIVSLIFPVLAVAHGTASQPDELGERAIVFPDTAQHLTLTTDLHTHSVFSDGHVWPILRVGEALRDGLDALAITEHLEYQPHRADIAHPDRNRAFDDASSAATGSNLLIIRGSEITRQSEAGHINAVFLSDANKLIHVETPPVDQADVSAYYQAASMWPAQNAVDAAEQQGAFVFWNHPFWSSSATDGIVRMLDFHRTNIEENKLHGIEIANGAFYSEEAFALALEHNLALIGTSDIHGLIDWDYEPHNGGHRPVTLVFADERSTDSIREALFARRTVVWYKNLLIGRPAHLQPLLEACLSITRATSRPDSSMVDVTISNNSDANFELRNTSKYTFMTDSDRVRVPAHGEIKLLVKPGAIMTQLELSFVVQNALTAPKQSPSITLEVTNIETVEP